MLTMISLGAAFVLMDMAAHLCRLLHCTTFASRGTFDLVFVFPVDCIQDQLQSTQETAEPIGYLLKFKK